jgi:hypothetical protein
VTVKVNGFNVKLTDQDVYKILYLNKIDGLQPYQLENLFPVSRATIKGIVNGKSRKECYNLFHEYKDTHLDQFKRLVHGEGVNLIIPYVCDID